VSESESTNYNYNLLELHSEGVNLIRKSTNWKKDFMSDAFDIYLYVSSVKAFHL